MKSQLCIIRAVRRVST